LDDVAAASIVADGGVAVAAARNGTSAMLPPTSTAPASAGVGLGNSILVEALLSVESLEPSEQAASKKAALAKARAPSKDFCMCM
jgi:hypothetical protein